jgi:phosphate transport system substrate-binding protein
MITQWWATRTRAAPIALRLRGILIVRMRQRVNQVMEIPVKNRALMLAATAVGSFVFAAPALAQRDQIRIVGSSTVYPFTTAVAEQFGKSGGFKTPVVESTGTGGGFRLFCGGVGPTHPDVSNASRAILKGEFELCQKNGVKDIVEIKVGNDGLTIAQSKAGPKISLSMAQVYLALAAQVPGPDGKLIANPYKNWSDIDKTLPNIRIEVLGPPPTSGTRDSFHELYMEAGAMQIKALADLRKSDRKAFDNAWKTLRQDGAFVEAGENDNVIVQKLEANRNAFGIFGFSFLDENSAKLNGVPIDGVTPDFDTIAAGKFKGARPLFIYIKKQHVGVIPGIEQFAAEYVSPKAMARDGYLARKGLVALPKAEADKVAAVAKAMTPMTAADIK